MRYIPLFLIMLLGCTTEPSVDQAEQYQLIQRCTAFSDVTWVGTAMVEEGHVLFRGTSSNTTLYSDSVEVITHDLELVMHRDGVDWSISPMGTFIQLDSMAWTGPNFCGMLEIAPGPGPVSLLQRVPHAQ